VKRTRTRNAYETGRPIAEFRLLQGNLGDIAINSFSDAKVVAQFTERFAEIGRTNGLIINVRRNSGGNSGLGNQIITYLIDKPALLPAPPRRISWWPSTARSACLSWGSRRVEAPANRCSWDYLAEALLAFAPAIAGMPMEGSSTAAACSRTSA
jgi:hypothetical protein